MNHAEMHERLESCPIIAAVRGEHFSDALRSPAEVIFLLEGSVMTVGDVIKQAHAGGKAILIHMDLMKGIGKDQCGVEYLAGLGADGIISTRAPLIKDAKDAGIIAVQRYFALDSQGLDSIDKMISSARPDFIEIMPGVISKVIERFAAGRIPVIAGGLIETKAEVTAALGCGATAVSTGRMELWEL